MSDEIVVNNTIQDDNEKGTSIVTAVFNLTTTVVGGGTLSLPYAFRMAGMVNGIIIVLFVCILCTLSAQLIIKGGNHDGEGASYKNLAIASFGPIGSKVVEGTLVIFCFGAICAYTVIIADLLPIIMRLIVGDKQHATFYLDSWFLSLIWISIVVAPLCMLKKMSALRFTSVFSLLSTLYIVGVIVFKGIQEEEKYGPVVRPDFDWSFKMFVSLPIMAIAYSCHFNIEPIEKELKNSSNKRVQTVATLAMIIGTIIYLLSGSFGFIKYGNATDSNILNNLTENHKDPVTQIGNIAFLFVVTFAYPLLCYPCRLNVKTLFFSKNFPDVAHVIVTLIIVFGAYGISLTGINLGFVFGIVGSTAGSLVAYILPGIFYLRLAPERISWRKFVAVVLVVIGSFFGVICTYATIRYKNLNN